jgi:hypothetical protein
MSTFKSLRELCLDNTKIDSSIIKDIVNSWNLYSLQSLSVRACKYLTGLALVHLHNGEHAKSLQSVLLDGTSIEVKVETRRLLKKCLGKPF